MAGLFRLFNSAYEANIARSLWLNASSLDTYALTELSSDSRPTIDYTLLMANPTGDFTAPWSRVLAANYALEIGLFKASDRSQLTLCTTFTNVDEYTKNGTLLLDAAAVMAAMAAAGTELACYFEIFVTDASGNRNPTYRNAITLKKPLIASGSQSSDPTNPVATVAFVQQMCVPRDGSAGTPAPFKEGYAQTEGGLNLRYYWDDQGRFQSQLF